VNCSYTYTCTIEGRVKDITFTTSPEMTKNRMIGQLLRIAKPIVILRVIIKQSSSLLIVKRSLGLTVPPIHKGADADILFQGKTLLLT